MGEPTPPTVGPIASSGHETLGERPDLLVDDHFAVVPEWVLDSEISDCALRLYAVLLRYGQTSGARMPSRATLARRLRKGSTDTVDRAMKELVTLGAVVVERRRRAGLNETNRYHLRTHQCATAGGRKDAATVAELESPQCQPEPVRVGVSAPEGGGGRMDAAGVAADLRPDPEFLTQRKPTPPHLPNRVADGDQLHALEVDRCDVLAQQVGLADGTAIEALAVELVAARIERRLPVASWSTRGLVAALQLSLQRGWPADGAVEVLRAVALDAQTRSPMRLAEAGPWWNPPPRPALRRTRQEDDELERLEAALADRDDRAWLQSRARADLVTSGQTVDRLSVARRATRLAEQTEQGARQQRAG